MRICIVMLLVLGCVDFTEDEQIEEVSTEGSAFDEGGSEDTGEPGLDPAGDYAEEGPWTPGNLQATITGSSGSTLYVDAWYPSSESGSEHRYYGWDSWGFDGESFTDVSPDCSEPRPVMVYSHGNGSIRWEMFYLQEFLSTHGWIVAGPDHEGNTLYDNTEDFDTLLWRRPQDLSDTFDWLVSESEDPASALHGCIDADAGYVATGYSFGGYTALVTAGALVNEGGAPSADYSDDRVWAVVSLAAWNAYGSLGTGTGEIHVPALTLGGEWDSTVGTQYQSLHGHIESTPRAMGSFARAGHYSFVPIYCSSWGNGCGPHFIDAEVFTAMTRTSVLSVVEHVRGRSGAIEQLPDYSDELSWERVD
jgi:predicted dienelactone hydrolase